MQIIHVKQSTPIDFVCCSSPTSSSPTSATLPILTSMRHNVIIKNAKELLFTGLKEHLSSFKMRPKTWQYLNSCLAEIKISLLPTHLEKRNIATFFGWRAQDTWPLQIFLRNDCSVHIYCVTSIISVDHSEEMNCNDFQFRSEDLSLCIIWSREIKFKLLFVKME